MIKDYTWEKYQIQLYLEKTHNIIISTSQATKLIPYLDKIIPTLNNPSLYTAYMEVKKYKQKVRIFYDYLLLNELATYSPNDVPLSIAKKDYGYGKVTTIRHYLRDFHNIHYTEGIPKKEVIIKQVEKIIPLLPMTNNTFFASYNSCMNIKQKVVLFYNYLVNEGFAQGSPKRVIINKKASIGGMSRITQSWVNSKINKLDGVEKWKALRYQALKKGNGKCCLCGRGAKDGITLHVDHIKPKSIYPEFQFDVNNLQVLCEECNVGKCNFDDTDWR